MKQILICCNEKYKKIKEGYNNINVTKDFFLNYKPPIQETIRKVSYDPDFWTSVIQSKMLEKKNAEEKKS